MTPTELYGDEYPSVLPAGPFALLSAHNTAFAVSRPAPVPDGPMAPGIEAGLELL